MLYAVGENRNEELVTVNDSLSNWIMKEMRRFPRCNKARILLLDKLSTATLRGGLHTTKSRAAASDNLDKSIYYISGKLTWPGLTADGCKTSAADGPVTCKTTPCRNNGASRETHHT